MRYAPSPVDSCWRIELAETVLERVSVLDERTQKDASSSVGRFIARFHVGELSTRAPLHRKTGYPNHSVVIWPQKLPFLLGDVRSCSAELD